MAEAGGEDSGRVGSATQDVTARLKALERESREPRPANEILGEASAYFAPADLGRRPKS